MKLRRWFLALALVLPVLLFPPAVPAEAADPALTDQGLDLFSGSVHWPQVEGMQDPELQAEINGQLRQAADADTLTARMAATFSGAVPLRADYEAWLRGGILSAALHAEGPLTDSRFDSRTVCVNLDILTGESFTLADCFTDPEGAESFLAGYLLQEVLPTLSPMLTAAELTPVPDSFSLSPTALTLHYDRTRFRTLSDRDGAISIEWPVLAEWLDLSGGSPLGRFDPGSALTPDAAVLREACSQGSLPGISARLGDDVQILLARWPLQIDPDFYRGGRYLELEGSAFRGVYLMTDALSGDDFEGSTVHGIRADRFGYAGLVTGVTTREEWQAFLGEPDASVTLPAGDAEALRMPEGVSDYYFLNNETRLRLHADTDGILRCVLILE